MQKNQKRASSCLSSVLATVLVLTPYVGVHVATHPDIAVAEEAQNVVSETDSIEYQTTDAEDSFGGADYEHGKVLVELKDGIDLQSGVDQIKENTGIEGFEIEEVSGDLAEISIPSGLSVAYAIDLIEQSPVVDAVQPDFIYQVFDDDIELEAASTAVNDAYRNTQWGLDSINAPRAWDLAKCNHAVTVAVIDNYFEIDHADLRDNIVAPYNAATSAASDMSGVNVPSTVNKGHGTHVAGVISARANNSIGVAGASYNARIMPIRVGDDSGNLSSSAIAKAYDYILANKDAYNVRVVNMSFGGAFKGTYPWDDDVLIKKIEEGRSRGIIPVAAAGNKTVSNGTSFDPPFSVYPSDYSGVVSVMALMRDSGNADGVSRTSFSNYNMTGEMSKNISAPGSSIVSCYEGQYSGMSGTSQAAPFVAATAALMVAKHPEYTANQVISRLYSTTRDLNASANSFSAFDAKTGWGEVDAYEAVRSSSALLNGSMDVVKGCSSYLSFTARQSGSWVWSSSDTTVATAMGNASGVTVTGVSTGSAFIVGVCGSSRVVAPIHVYSPVISGETTIGYGDISKLSIAHDTNSSWIWSSSNPTVASVGSSTGVVSGNKVGSAIITATLASNSSIKAATLVYVSRKPLSDAVISIPQRMNMYTGSAIAPTFDVSLNGNSLVSGTDYRYSFSNNVNAGIATLTITGIGNYTDSATSNFAIVKTFRPVSNGTYTIKSSVNAAYSLDVNGGSRSDGGNIQVYQNNGTDAQQWDLTYVSDGYYKVVSVNSGKAMDIADVSFADGANVHQWSYVSGSNQLWGLVSNSDGTYMLLNKNSGKVLDLSAGVAQNGQNVHQWQSNGTNAQKWRLSTVSYARPIANGTYSIRSACNGGYALDVNGGSRSDGANVQLWSYNGTAAQRWTFTYCDHGYYSITAGTGKCLDVADVSYADGANVHQWSYVSGLNQLWKPVRNFDGSYTFYNRNSGKVLDLAAGVAQNGQNIHQWQSNGTVAQRWRVS